MSEQVEELAKSGQLDRLKECDETLLVPSLYLAAAYFGHLDVIKWLYEEKHLSFPENPRSVLAHSCGHLDVLQYVLTIIPVATGALETWACYNASRRGNVECLRYLHAHGYPWGSDTLSSAAEKGHLECLKYAYENGCPWNEYCLLHAATYGNLDCLRYAHEQGMNAADFNICGHTAWKGHIDCLTFLFENGYTSSRLRVGDAVVSGNIECVKFLLLQGYELSDSDLFDASWRGHFEVFEYLYEYIYSPHSFLATWPGWNTEYNYSDGFADKFDLDKHMWRKSLFHIDLSAHPALQSRVRAKQQEIEERTQACVQATSINEDVVNHVVRTFL